MSSPRAGRKRPKLLHIGRFFPNMLTLLGLCAALTAVRFALAEKWEIAVLFVLLAATMDGIDGWVARMLRSTSPFGAQLDSLCDTVNFGVAPALILFLWQVQSVERFGWACTLFFVICCALRLARFNTQLDAKGHNAKSDRFFEGVPAPAAAILALSPLMLYLWAQENEAPYELLMVLSNPLALCFYLLALGGLMVSTLPTFSLKKLVVKPRLGRLVLLGVGILFILLFSEPWMVIPVLSAGYLLSIPVSAALAKKQEQKARSV